MSGVVSCQAGLRASSRPFAPVSKAPSRPEFLTRGTVLQARPGKISSRSDNESAFRTLSHQKAGFVTRAFVTESVGNRGGRSRRNCANRTRQKASPPHAKPGNERADFAPEFHGAGALSRADATSSQRIGYLDASRPAPVCIQKWRSRRFVYHPAGRLRLRLESDSAAN